MLAHRIRNVLPPLAPHVEHLWMVRGYLARPWRNMILPDGAVELIINLGDPSDSRPAPIRLATPLSAEAGFPGNELNPS